MNGHPGRACLDCGTADPPPEMTCTLGRDHRVGRRIPVPGLPPADCRVHLAAILSEKARPGAQGRAMRYREDTPAEQARARTAVEEWREQNPGGTTRSWSARSAASSTRITPLCSAALFAADRDQARSSPGTPGAPGRDGGRLRRAALGLVPAGAGPGAPVWVRAANPGVMIAAGEFGTWQARIPEADGERSPSATGSAGLLDRLDELTGGSSPAGRQARLAKTRGGRGKPLREGPPP